MHVITMVVVLLLITRIIFVATSSFPCRKTLVSSSEELILTGTYDLCDFVIDSNSINGWYAAYDNRSIGNAELYGGDAVNYTFYFNIASNIAKPTPDPECDNYNITYRMIHGLEIGYCKDIASPGLPNATCRNPMRNYVPIIHMAAAYQSKKGKTNTDRCWRLHDGVTEPIWTFLDNTNPALGIQLTYINGDWCQSFGQNREFTIKFICARDTKTTPDYKQTVYEPIDSGCSYEIRMKTYKGCPIECAVVNDQLCSDHGVCNYDWNLGSPKCFCYCGWTGDACSISTNEICDDQKYNATNDTNKYGCRYELTDINGITAEYDLRDFHLDGDVFRVIDSQNSYFQYVFNICGDIEAQIFYNNQIIPHECLHPNSNHGPCIRTHQEENSAIPVCDGYENTAAKTASALQIDAIDNKSIRCYWLGMEISAEDHMPQYKIQLLDAKDAGKGIIYTILNGEWCSSVGRNRQLRIKLECPDDPRIEFEPAIHQTQINAADVYEVDTCIYELAIVSPLACPNKCISRMNLEMFAVCGTHGICVADPYANGVSQYPFGAIRCLCDDDYSGVMCEHIKTTNPTTLQPTNKPTQLPLHAGQTHSPTTNRTQQSEQSDVSKNDSHMMIVWILVGVIVVLIALVLFYAYYNRKHKRLMLNFVRMTEESNEDTNKQSA